MTENITETSRSPRYPSPDPESVITMDAYPTQGDNITVD